MLEQLEQLDRQLTLSINGSHSLFIDGVAITATSTTTWIPVACVLLYVIIHNNEMKNIGWLLLGMVLCILLADQGASSICKPLVARWRPANDPHLMYLVDVVNDYRGGRYGFFSSHAANTFAIATFTGLIVRDARLGIALTSWALLNCWTRIYLGVHYVGDIAVGIIYGTIIGALVWRGAAQLIPRLRTPATGRRDIQTSTGYQLSDVRLLIATILATYVFICFKALFFS